MPTLRWAATNLISPRRCEWLNRREPLLAVMESGLARLATRALSEPKSPSRPLAWSFVGATWRIMEDRVRRSRVREAWVSCILSNLGVLAMAAEDGPWFDGRFLLAGSAPDCGLYR